MLPAVFDFLNGPVRDLRHPDPTMPWATSASPCGWPSRAAIIPIPSELVLPFAGFLVGEGVALEPITGQPWNFWLTVLAGTIGATAGALIAYAHRGLGRAAAPGALGPLHRLIRRRDLDKADDFFARHGEADQLLRPAAAGRPDVLSVPGRRRPHAARQVHVFSFLGALPWTALLVFAGRAAGRELGVGRRLAPAVRRRDRRRSRRRRACLDLVPDHQAAAGRARPDRLSPLFLGRPHVAEVAVHQQVVQRS